MNRLNRHLRRDLAWRQSARLRLSSPLGGCAVSIDADWHELPLATRRRLIRLGLLRVLATTIVLVALYYLPACRSNRGSTGLTLRLCR
jgi:hypothetical protein